MTVSQLIEVLQELEEKGQGDYWIEHPNGTEVTTLRTDDDNSVVVLED